MYFALLCVFPAARRTGSRQRCAEGAQDHRSRQGRADESKKNYRGRSLCLDAKDRDERKQENRRDRTVSAHCCGVVQMSNAKLRIGYIPLVDAISLVVAVDSGFAAAEGLDAELVREVS